MNNTIFYVIYFPDQVSKPIELKEAQVKIEDQEIVLTNSLTSEDYNFDVNTIKSINKIKIGIAPELSVEFMNGVAFQLQPISEDKDYLNTYTQSIDAIHKIIVDIQEDNQNTTTNDFDNKQTNTPKDVKEPILMSKVGHMKKLIGPINLRAYSREDSLLLYEDRVDYVCVGSPEMSISMPLSSLKKVKQRLQELHFYTKSGEKHSFEIGNPLSSSTGMAAGGLIGLGIINKGVSASGINEWFTQLKDRGVNMDDSLYNTSKGSKLATLRVFLWTVLGLFSLLLCVAVYAAIIGRDGGKPQVFAVEVPVVLGCIILLRAIPKSGR